MIPGPIETTLHWPCMVAYLVSVGGLPIISTAFMSSAHAPTDVSTYALIHWIR